MKNIVILISGRGSNMQAIVNADIPNANIAAVLSNNETAAGFDRQHCVVHSKRGCLRFSDGLQQNWQRLAETAGVQPSARVRQRRRRYRRPK